MPKTFATIMTEAAQDLQDTAGTIWGQTVVTGELPLQLERAFKEVSDFKPHIRKLSFFIESRVGTATSTTSNALVDSTKAQFLSTDVGKWIKNKKDLTWAEVTVFVSTSQLTLSKDIFVADEGYSMFNKGCSSNKQFNIEDMIDTIGGDHGVMQDTEHSPEYPLGTKVNVKVTGDIVTLDIDYNPDNSDAANTGAQTEIFVWFTTRHRVSQMTDLAGAVDLGAGYVAGSTSMVIDDLTSSEIISEGQLFTIAGIRGVYMATAAVTVGSLEATVTFYPGLDSAAEDDDAVTFIGSTLTAHLERLVVDLTTSRAFLSKYANNIPLGGEGTYARFERKLALVLSELEDLLEPETKTDWPKE